MTTYFSPFKILLLFQLSITGINAQLMNHTVMLSGGENYKQQNINFSWSLGEITTETYEKNGITLNQGFQQTFSKKPTVGVKEINTLTLSVYPNPATSHFIIRQESTTTKLKYSIFNVQGVLLRNGEANESETKISLEGISDGILIVRLTDSNNVQPQTFKIFKIN
jgi:hypothetical protein